MSDPLRAGLEGALDELEEVGAAEPAPLPVHEGDVIADKYRLDRLIGIGGMAAVLRATHLELDQPVAIKLLRPEQVSRPDAVKRFLREARAAVRLRSSHVARVLDVGTSEVRGGAQVPYMVMELLEGSDFETVLEGHGPFQWQEAIEYILQACDAVAEAHSLGIIHRDLKPANLFLTTRRSGAPLVKLLDFGISKTQNRPLDQKITHEHAMVGSPAYMSPEQVRSSKDVDARSDIWSLGAILFELLTGREPFNGETPADTLAQILNDPAPQVRSLKPEMPEAVDAIVMKCLDKEPANRWQSVGELARALSLLLPRRQAASLPAWEPEMLPGDHPSSERLLAAFDAQRAAAMASLRLPTPAPLMPMQPASISGIAITADDPLPPSSRAAPKRARPWWHMPAVLGVVAGVLVIAAVVIFVVRRRGGSTETARGASTAAGPAGAAGDVAPAPADSESAMDPMNPPNITASAALPSANVLPRAPSTGVDTRGAGGAKSKDKPTLNGVPRHRTDW